MAAHRSKHDPLKCEFCIEIAKLKKQKAAKEDQLTKQEENIKYKNGLFDISLERREQRRIQRENEKTQIRARIDELAVFEA